MSVYLEDYHRVIDGELRSPARGSEMITEIYVPRGALEDFLGRAAEDLRRSGDQVVYGTVRWIERDEECLLTWARQPWACVIFNLHVDHTGPGIAAAADAFRRLIDRGLELGGSYFLTYHRWASAAQLRAAHPRIEEAFAAKLRHDPRELFTSDWYRHLRGQLEA